MDSVHRLKPTCIARVRIGERENLRDTISVCRIGSQLSFGMGIVLSHVPGTVMARSLPWLALLRQQRQRICCTVYEVFKDHRGGIENPPHFLCRKNEGVHEKFLRKF
jgi:hypothetical protein